MASIAGPSASTTTTLGAVADDGRNSIITVGRLVHVQPRTWPGINKQGGVGRVLRVEYNDRDNDNDNGNNTADQQQQPSHVDVKYVLGSSKEKRVPIEYVRLAVEYEDHLQQRTTDTSRSNQKTAAAASGGFGPGGVESQRGGLRNNRSLRDRNMLQGRCTRCGSLRVDCGSCDWATEDDVVVAPLPAGTARTKKPPGRTRTGNTTLGRTKFDHSYDSNDDDDDDDVFASKDDDSSDSDDDRDMKELHQLLQEARRRRRNFQRKRRRWKRISSAGGHSSISRLTELKNSSEVEKEDSGLIDHSNSRPSLNRKDQQRGYSLTKKIQQRRSRGANDSLANVGNEEMIHHQKIQAKELQKRQRRKSRLEGRSVLETLGRSAQSGETSSQRSSVRRKKGEVEKTNNLLESHAESEESSETDDFVKGGDEADSDSSPTRGQRQSMAVTEQSHVMYQDLAERAVQRARSGTSGQDGPEGNDLSVFPRDAFDGSQFIQPEGQDAVENLPEDMIDLTKGMPYYKLAPFFDDLASKIEDERLPDSKLKIAQIQRELRQIESESSTNGQSDGRNGAMKQLLQRCGTIWEDVRQSLIRSGTDQCRAALRRLDNDRLYRKVKKNLTAHQRKMCRGLGVMDYRQLRMDSLNEAVDELWKKLKQIVDRCESMTIEEESDGGKSDVSESYSMATSDESSAAVDNTFGFFDDEDTPFHDSTTVEHMSPENHPHARRKRRSNSEDENDGHLSSKIIENDVEKQSAVTKRRKTSSKDTRSGRRTHPNGHGVEGSSDLVSTPASGAEKELPNRKSRRRVSEGTKRTRVESQKKISLLTGLERPARDAIPISQRMQSWFDAQDSMSEPEQQPSDDEESDTDYDVYHQSHRKATDRRTSSVRVHQDSVNAIPGQSYRGNDKVPDQDGRYESWRSISDDNNDRSDDIQIHTGTKDDEAPGNLCECIMSYEELQSKGRPNASLINVVEACETLERTYFESPSECSAALVAIEGELSSNEVPSTFLRAVHTILIKSPRTLVEVLATDEMKLSTHSHLLALCVRSFQYDKNDAKLPHIFQTRNRRRFLDFVVLQLVDVLYAIFLPSGWGNVTTDEVGVLRQLLPLREALARCMPLVESVCLCIEQRLEQQEWALDHAEQRLFITSVKPSEWKNCIESAAIAQKKNTDIRLRQLGNVWSRAEAGALWKCIGFASSSPSSANQIPNGESRWRMISRIFLCGVLFQDDSKGQNSLRPSKEQLVECESHFDCLLLLLKKGSMGSVPDNDAVLSMLVRRGLKLEGDAFLGSSSLLENERFDSNSTKTVSRLWRSSHPTFFDSVDLCDSHPTVDELTTGNHGDSLNLISRLFGPMPGVLQRCLHFICLYARCLPKKGVRLNRFDKSLASIQNFLLKEAAEGNNTVESGRPASFDEAFESASENHGTVFLLEASVKISMIRCILRDVLVESSGSKGRNEGDINLHSRTWQSMADGVMKKRQETVLLGFDGPTHHRYSGGQYRLVKVSEAMAGVLCVQMNLPLWFPSDQQTGKILRKTVDLDGANAAFVISCMFASLDCLCDLTCEDSVLSRMYKPIVLTFLRLILGIKSGRSCSGVAHLKSVCMSRFGPVLYRCLEKHMVSSDLSQDGRISFRLFLTLIRSMQSFVVTEPQSQPPMNTTEISNGTADEDLWGSIDDEELLALDLGGTINPKQSNCGSSDNRIWVALLKAIEASMPSKRFAVSQQRTSQIHATPLGKDRIAKEVRRIVECIALKVVSDDNLDSDLSSALFWTRLSLIDNDDSVFCSEVAQYLTRELCSLHLIPSFGKNDVRTADAEAMLTSFLSSLFDSNRLDLLPTSNLQRIQARNGDDASDRASMLLDLFNDTTGHGSVEWIQARQRQSHNRDRAFKVWGFAKDFRSMFGASRCTSFGLICSQLQIPDHDRMLDLSIESETHRIYVTVQRLIAFLGGEGSDTFFEQFCSLVLFLMSKSILKVIEGIQYNENNNARSHNDPELRFRLAKLNECLVCYMELFIAVAVSMILNSPKSFSERWASLVARIRDKFFVLVLRKAEAVDVSAFFLKVLEESEIVLSPNGCNYMNSRVSSSFKAKPVDSNNFFGIDLFSSVIRRARQFMLSSLLNDRDRSLQVALVDALLKSGDTEEIAIANVIGSSLTTNWLAPLKYFSSTSPLQRAIDEYSVSADNQFIVNESEDRSQLEKLSNGKILFMQTYVLPSLTHPQTSLQKKRKLLFLLAYSLSSGLLSEQDMLSKGFICLAVKAISTAVFQCLVSSNPDDRLVAAAFLCSQHVSTTYVERVAYPNDTPQTTISHCYSTIPEVNGKSLLDLTATQSKIAYILSFFHWVFGLAKIIAGPSALVEDNISDTTLDTIRQAWKEQGKDGRVGGIGEDAVDFSTFTQPFETWDRRLVDLGGLLYPASISSSKPAMTNIYQKANPSNETVDRAGRSASEGNNLSCHVSLIGAQRGAKELIASMVLSL